MSWMFGAPQTDPLVTWFSTRPSHDSLPPGIPSPFDDTGPHPLAREAALAQQEELRSGWIAP
ncbi:MAG: hypothetical protein SGI90_05425, partial [Candidatus Eisenbacteria bacterium]|nr:hypothetical protein [Candidatus Eisenbacteria bacterium]